MTIAVIDIGKTNLKAVLFGEDGQLLAERSAPNHSLPGPPYLHFDIEAIWAFILTSLRALNDRGPIRTISITTHGASGALVDESGLVLPVMDYEERLVDEIEPDYAPLRPAFSESMSPPMTGGLNLGRGVFYQWKRHRQAFEKAKWLLTLPQYWAWRLTGIAAGEATSLACHTDLWAPAPGRPSSMARACGFDRLIPPLRRAFEPLGKPLPAICAATGLDADVTVLTGIHDSNASLALQLSGREAPFTVISTGTWIVLLHLGGDLRRLDPAADMMANVDAAGRPVACAKFMGGREFSAIAGDGMHEAKLEAARAVIERGLLALPAFSDQGGPFAGRRGGFIGGAPANEAERTALASLYSALVTNEQLDRLDARGPVIIDGNFAANAVYLGALAALRPGQTIEASQETAGTAKGAAALAVWPQVFGNRQGRMVEAFEPDQMQGYKAAWRKALSS